VNNNHKQERVDPDFKSYNERYYKVKKRAAKHVNLIGNLENEFRLPTYSKAFKPSNIIGELEWKANFTKYSKNNDTLPRPFREYFDAPVSYDVRGFTYSSSSRPKTGKTRRNIKSAGRSRPRTSVNRKSRTSGGQLSQRETGLGATSPVEEGAEKEEARPATAQLEQRPR